MGTITPGRKPTLGEVIEYYTREDFLTFLKHLLTTTRVVTVIPSKLHWEPNWKEDEVIGDSLESLRLSILSKIQLAYPDLGMDQSPPFYPSFHQSVWKQIDRSNPASNQKDCVFEADLPTWRESFRDVAPAMTLMDAHSVRYRHKFSGHRSLHIVIPAEIIPQGYRGQGAQKLAGHILKWSSSVAHSLPKITRMPYSLNEDTGMVCLPIARGGLANFRPWMANIHLVDIDISEWDESLTSGDAEATANFIQATDDQDPIINPSYFVVDWSRINTSFKEHLRTVSKANPSLYVWSRLADEMSISLDVLKSGMDNSDVDTRWLTLEAYLFHGTSLNESAINILLDEQDEYARVSATDILLQYEDVITPYLISVMSRFDQYTETSAKVALLLALSETLRHKVLDALVSASERPYDAIIISACLAGCIANDWKSARRILAPLAQTEILTSRQRVQYQALALIETMGGWNRKKGVEQAMELAALGSDITDLLLLAAASSDRRLRRDIVSALAELADPRTVNHLVHALGDEYSKVRRKAIRALVRIGAPAVEPLIQALGSDLEKIRGYAAACLGHIRDPRAKHALLALLDDEDENVRRRAIRSIKDMVTVDDLPRLMAIIQTAQPEHATPLIETISTIGEPARAAMEDLALRTRHPNAAYYLASCGDRRGRDILISLLESKDEDVAYAAVEHLTELREPQVVPFLANYLKTLNHWRAMWYAAALGEIGTPEAVDALIAGLDRDYVMARRGAMRGLAAAKDPRAIPYIIKAMSDNDGKMRNLAGEALLAIGEPSIIPLQQALVEEGIAARRRRNRVLSLLDKLGKPQKIN